MTDIKNEMKFNSKIYLAGHNGLVGSAILRKLKTMGFTNVVVKSREELDLTRQKDVELFFEKEKPEYVFLAAAKVGGIVANNSYPADFITENLLISSNIINASFKYGVKKLCNLGSSCIYPRLAPQPMKESCLLTSELEKTNEAYAVAKIAAIKQCFYYNKQYGTNFISVMPTNQYGIGDNFNMETAHLLPMVMRRFHLAKLLQKKDFDAIRHDLQMYKLGWGLDSEFSRMTDQELESILNKVGAFEDKVIVWGDGTAYRELMSSDDLADACVYLMQNCCANDVGELVNVTAGTDIQLKELFKLIQKVVGFEGDVVFDATKPNGTPRKLMDAEKIRSLGWTPKIDLESGISNFYQWYLSL